MTSYLSKIRGFKVGDIVSYSGSINDRYNVTNEKSKLKIVEIIGDNDDDLCVEVLEHTTHPEEIGKTFWVSSQHFSLVKKNKSNETDKERLAKQITRNADIMTNTIKNILRGHTDYNQFLKYDFRGYVKSIIDYMNAMEESKGKLMEKYEETLKNIIK